MIRSLANSQTLRGAALFLVVLCLFACESEENEGLPGDNVTLAKVQDRIITGYDLERALDKSLGQFSTPSVERSARGPVLESLIESKAMAHLAENELRDNERLVLDKEVAAYRENLLVKQYLAKKSPPEKITEKEIRKYYNDHPARFGAATERRYELIFGKQAVRGNARVAMLKELSALSKEENWKQLIVDKGDEVRLGFSAGVESEQALHSKLKEMLRALKLGQTSNIVFVQGRPYVGRIMDESEVQKRPLVEVEARIRRTLQLVHTRDAIQKVGKDAAKQLKVKRLKAPQKGGDDAS